MNPLYDQIKLTQQEDGYHLMGFEGTDAGVLSFKPGLEGDESGTWQKVQAVVDGAPIEGYVNIDHALLKGRILADLPNSTELAHSINDFVISQLIPKSLEEKEHLATLMHLGITPEEYESDPVTAANKVFLGGDVREKTADYESKIASNPESVKKCLDHLYKEFVLAAVGKNGKALQYASADLKADREVVLAAVRQYGDALRYASEILKTDKSFILEAVRQNGNALYYASPELKADREVVLAAVEQNGDTLGGASADLKNDREIVLAAVRQSGIALCYASPELKADREVVLAAVEQNGGALEYAAEALKDDKEVVLAAVRQSGYDLRYASEALKKDKEVVLAAVRRDGDALRYAAEALKKDKEVVLAAVEQNGYALYNASPELKADKEVVLAAVGQNERALCYVSNREAVLVVLKQNWKALAHVSEALKDDKEVVLAAVGQNEGALGYASKALKDDKEFMNIAYKEYLLGSLIRGQSAGVESPVTIEDLHRLQENYQAISQLIEKEKGIFNSTEASDFIKDPTDSALKKLKNKMKSSKIEEVRQNEIIEYLLLESFCLKALGLEKVDSLRMIPKITKEITDYRNKEISTFLRDKIFDSKVNSALFLDQLAQISKGKTELILPAVLLSTYQEVSLDDFTVISSAFDKMKKYLSNQTKPHLQAILQLEQALSTTSVTDVKKVQLIKSCLIEGQDLPEILARVQLLTVISKSSSEILDMIDDFSSGNLRELAIRKLIEGGLLENTPETKQRFVEAFLSSRDPSAIFTYAANFADDPQMQSAIKAFIASVINGSFKKERNLANSHERYLTPDQKGLWEAGASKELTTEDTTSEVAFDPRSFLIQKLVNDDHGGGKLDLLKSSLKSGAAIEAPSEVESLCLELFNAREKDEQVRLLRELKTALEDKEFEGIEFKHDVESLIQHLTTESKKSTGLKLIDSDDWQDLFLCGTEVAGSCQRVDGDPYLNKCLMGYVLDGKVRILKVAGSDGKMIARSIVKIVLTEDNKPALFFERVYPTAEYESALKQFAQERASALRLPLYEEGMGESLHSVANIAPFEYEDAAGGVTEGKYTISGQRIS